MNFISFLKMLYVTLSLAATEANKVAHGKDKILSKYETVMEMIGKKEIPDGMIEIEFLEFCSRKPAEWMTKRLIDKIGEVRPQVIVSLDKKTSLN